MECCFEIVKKLQLKKLKIIINYGGGPFASQLGQNAPKEAFYPITETLLFL